MDEKEELKQQLQQELQWVHYRQRMLNIMEEKLLQMRQLADRANNLVALVRALDGESRSAEGKY
jgi:hypothetical protein